MDRIYSGGNLMKLEPRWLLGLLVVFIVFAAAFIFLQARPVAPDISYAEATLTGGGFYNTAAQGSVAENSQFQVGSISKFVCSLAAMDMEKDGLLSLDDSVKALLPAYIGPGGDKITLAHLLQNRSGLEDDIMDAFRADQRLAVASIPSLEASNRYAASALKSPPGQEFDYIISNWILVQAILERVEGSSLETVLKNRVFGPADMVQTRVFSGLLQGGSVAPPASPATPVPDFLSCAGGIASTAGDLVKLVRHPFHTAGLSEEALDRFTAISTPQENYALGGRYQIMNVGDVAHNLSWQSGSNGAYKSIAVYDPVLDIGYAVLTADDARNAIEAKRDLWLEKALMGQN